MSLPLTPTPEQQLRIIRSLVAIARHENHYSVDIRELEAVLYPDRPTDPEVTEKISNISDNQAAMDIVSPTDEEIHEMHRQMEAEWPGITERFNQALDSLDSDRGSNPACGMPGHPNFRHDCKVFEHVRQRYDSKD